MWDLRRLVEPTHSLVTGKSLSMVKWCPTRSGILATLAKDEPFIRLWGQLLLRGVRCGG